MKSTKFYQKLGTLMLPLLIGVYLIVGNRTILENSKDIEEDYPIWIKMMETPSVNLEEAKKAFDNYWEQHTHSKGNRSKQFERWYARNSKRLDKYGNVISATQVNKEFQKMRSMAFVSQLGNWTNYGPINVGKNTDGDPRNGGRVKDVSFHPTDADTYLVSCFKSGLFKTTDSGSSWTPLTDHLPEEVYISKFHATNPDTIYIGTNSGVLKSTDGGATWATTGLSTNITNALIIKTDTIVAGTENGIYHSTNGGSTFTLVKSANKVEELRIHPTNPNIMYAGTNGTTSQFFRSTDGGLSWTENTTDFGQGAFIKIAVTPDQPNYVYVINSRDHEDQDSFEGVYRSIDSGVSFTKQSSVTPCITGYNINGSASRGQPNYNLFIVADPTNADIVYAGGVKSWKSIDGGVNWTQSFDNVTDLGFSLHLDQLTWAYSPVNNKLFALNDGGIWFLNEDNKFQSITDGLPIAEVWECTQSKTTKDNVAGGTFHCGIKLNRNGTWYSPWGGDEATVVFDYSDDTYAYHFKYEKIHRSSDGGFTFQRINPTTADRGEYTGTGLVDKSDVNTLFAGLFEVERINNARTATNSTVWDKISSFGGNTKIQKIEQSGVDFDILYVSRGGNFYRSDNVRVTSPTFTNISETLPSSGTITDIATHPTNASIVYILQGSKIYKSSDKGATWSNISTGLPEVALLEMVYDDSSDEGIYIGTDIGVYYKDATLSSWIDYSNNLPVIRVSGMDIFYGVTRAESVLTIATDGRGFWRSKLNDVEPSTNQPVADFTSDITTVIEGGSISFTDTSTNTPTSWSWSFTGGTPDTSTVQNPTVTYPTAGTYQVSLTATNAGGSDTKTEVGYITVNPPSSGTLQGHYKFDENILDASSYNVHLTDNGDTPYIGYETDHNNVVLSAATAGGIDSYLENSDDFPISGNMDRTVAAWIKTSDSTGTVGIVSMGATGAYQKFSMVLLNGLFRAEISGTGINGAANVADGTWHHVAATYSHSGNTDGTITLYVDGDVETTLTNATWGSVNTTASSIIIGNEKSGLSTRGFTGALDDVRIYSEALSATEIAEIFSPTIASLSKQSQQSIKQHETAESLEEIRFLKIYPNPALNVLKVSLSEMSENDKNVLISINSLSGKLLYTDIYRNFNREITIDTSQLPIGVYIVSVNIEGVVYYHKMVRQ